MTEEEQAQRQALLDKLNLLLDGEDHAVGVNALLDVAMMVVAHAARDKAGAHRIAKSAAKDFAGRVEHFWAQIREERAAAPGTGRMQ